jgi:hypothetical protein
MADVKFYKDRPTLLKMHRREYAFSSNGTTAFEYVFVECPRKTVHVLVNKDSFGKNLYLIRRLDNAEVKDQIEVRNSSLARRVIRKYLEKNLAEDISF